MKDNWTIKVFILTFVLAIIFSLISNFLGNFNNFVLVICILSILVIGIIFDVIGVAVLSCDIKAFHSRASQKIKGARTAIRLIKNSSSVSSFCNDVVGDVCGIVSGSLVTVLVVNLFLSNNLSMWNVILSSILSSLTVGGKAIGKKIAIKNANDITYFVGRVLSIFSKEK